MFDLRGWLEAHGEQPFEVAAITEATFNRRHFECVPGLKVMEPGKT